MADHDWDLCCFGNAMVDIFACADEETAARFGISQPVQHVDIDLLIKMLPALGDYTRASGGGAANAAKIAALLGTRVCFSGAVGGEEFGRFFEEELLAAGVSPRLAKKAPPTGLCLMLRGGGNEARVAASPSAALELSEGDISDADIERAKAVVIDGYILDRPALVRKILLAAGKSGKAAAIDLGSAFIAKERVLEILEYSRQHQVILFMNEEEAEAFYEGLKSHGVEVQDLSPAEEEEESHPTERRKRGSPFRRACTFFQALTGGKPFPIITLKLAHKGAMVFSGGNIYRAGTEAAEPVDTTGAGDAFCAAFLSAWVQGRQLTECAEIGNMAARIILGVTGTQAGREIFLPVARRLQ